MGTQQILMIVLSVIIVGAAIAVGIQMFDTQANNQARNALVSDMMQFGVNAQAWYRQPVVMGGPGTAGLVAGNLPECIAFINRDWTGTGPFVNTTGSYVFTVGTTTRLNVAGTSVQNPAIQVWAAITLTGGTEADGYGVLISSTGALP